MTTIRVQHRDRFVVIDQATVRDPRLSLRAMGLLVRLLSYPDNWRINSDEIGRQVREGRDAVRRALAELEDAGYLTRTKCRFDTATKRGLWRTELVLRESPGRSDDGFSGVGENGAVDNRETDTTHEQAQRDESPGRSDDGFPGVGFPGVGNPGAIRKTVTKDWRGENFATASTGACSQCDGTGYVLVDIPTPDPEHPRRRQFRTEAHRCACNPIPRGKARSRR